MKSVYAILYGDNENKRILIRKLKVNEEYFRIAKKLTKNIFITIFYFVDFWIGIIESGKKNVIFSINFYEKRLLYTLL